MRCLFIISLFVFVLAGCNTETARSGCQYEVTVVDQTGLDGCAILFRLGNDDFLEPVDWQAERPSLEVGETFYINYQEVSDATVCMVGKPVRITCITPE